MVIYGVISMSQDKAIQDTNTPKKWFTIKEAADYLGVSQPTIFRWMKEGVLSFYKIGGSTRFSQEGLDSLIEKSTGEKEAAQAAGCCVVCGHTILVEGRVQATGKLFFKPAKSSFWVLHEAMVPTQAKACPACGHIQFYVEPQKLRDLKPREIAQTQEDKTAPEDVSK